jgi:hypothetical protein
MARIINSQPKEEEAPGVPLPNPDSKGIIEIDASKQSLEQMRLKTIDQIRASNRESPYLNTNPKMVDGPHLQPV